MQAFMPVERSTTGTPMRTGPLSGAPFTETDTGDARIAIRELDRVEIDLAGDSARTGDESPTHFSCYLRIGSELRPAPIGSVLDAVTGRFVWQPGVGFIGPYDLVFERRTRDGGPARLELRVTIVPSELK